MEYSKTDKNTFLNAFKLSIVIPTVGEESLDKLLEQIKLGSFIPNEIIVVFPTIDIVKTIRLNPDGIKLFRSSKSGQVAQRSYGIHKAKNKYILQLDADIEIKKDTIEKLIFAYFIYGPKVVVGPQIKCPINEGNSKKIKEKKWKVFFKIFGGGNINIVDRKKPFRYDSWFYDFRQPLKSGYTNVLPGACVLFNKDYYKNFDYFPFKGKALGEDILNSIYFQKYGCQLYYEAEAKISMEDPGIYSYKSLEKLFKDLIIIYKIKLIACNLAKGNFIRFHVWFFYYVFSTLIKFFIYK